MQNKINQWGLAKLLVWKIDGFVWDHDGDYQTEKNW